MDEIHRTGVRYLTKAIASDPTFEPAYALRAGAHLKLNEARQAVRDYTKALELDPKDKLYGDRASAESELREYQAAILDYTKRISQGCEDTLCGAYEYRADVYLKLHDYPHAVGDLTLRLFPEYAARNSEETLDYEDRALVELLTDFTRVSERSVSPQFWRRNIAVMEATIELLARTSSALKLLANV